MNEMLLASATALWLGVITSISPCPLATNIAAVSYLMKLVEHPRKMFASSLLYIAGRAVTYLALGALLVTGILAAPAVSGFLQTYMNKILGPLLILVGMVLVNLISLSFGGRGVSGGMKDRVDRMGVWGAAPLGMVLALAFCPVSAALFFGSLVPLAAREGSRVWLPLVYGLGTALPVAAFAILLAFGTHVVAKVFHRLTKIELWLRYATGVVFILIGIYLSMIYIILAR